MGERTNNAGGQVGRWKEKKKKKWWCHLIASAAGRAEVRPSAGKRGERVRCCTPEQIGRVAAAIAYRSTSRWEREEHGHGMNGLDRKDEGTQIRRATEKEGDRGKKRGTKAGKKVADQIRLSCALTDFGVTVGRASPGLLIRRPGQPTGYQSPSSDLFGVRVRYPPILPPGVNLVRRDCVVAH